MTHLAALSQIIMRNTVMGAYPDTHKIAEEAFQLGVQPQATQIEQLRAALEPFAKAADFYDDCEQHPCGCPDGVSAGELVDLTVGDFRTARQAYEDTK
jgi:hypothetical protein